VVRWLRAETSTPAFDEPSDVDMAPFAALVNERARRERTQTPLPAAAPRRASEPAVARERSQPAISLAAAGAVTHPGATGAAAVTFDGPVVIEARRPRRGAEDDFDALETVTLLPGERPGVVVPAPAPRVPVWRRPLALSGMAAAVVSVVAVMFLNQSGSASSGAATGPAEASGQHRQPVVEPIVEPGAATAPPAGGVLPAAGARALRADDARAATPVASDGEISLEEPADDAGAGEDKGARGDDKADRDKGDRRDRRDRRGRPDKRDRRDRTAQEPRGAKDPEPPQDVKFVDPFEK
jgi:hypothetical protein